MSIKFLNNRNIFKSLPSKRIIFPICYNNNFSFSEFNNVINFCNNNVDHLHIVLCDSLQRHTTSIFKENNYFPNKTTFDKNIATCFKNAKIDKYITQWHEFLHSTDYGMYGKFFIDKLYKEDELFKTLVNKRAIDYYEKNKDNIITDRQYAINTNIKYLLEESAVIMLWKLYYSNHFILHKYFGNYLLYLNNNYHKENKLHFATYKNI